MPDAFEGHPKRYFIGEWEGHQYLIPIERREDWFAFVNGELPAWAGEPQYGLISFEHPAVERGV